MKDNEWMNEYCEHYDEFEQVKKRNKDNEIFKEFDIEICILWILKTDEENGKRRRRKTKWTPKKERKKEDEERKKK